jgi:hypothetical protein
MLVLLNNPQIHAQFMDAWLTLPPEVKPVLEDRVSIVSDGEAFPGIRPPDGEESNAADAIKMWYDDGAQLYTLVILEQGLAEGGGVLRRRVAQELAKVYHDAGRITAEIRAEIEQGGELEPWIAEVLSECNNFDEFWTWLAEMYDFEAWVTAREWIFGGLSVRKMRWRSDQKSAARRGEISPEVGLHSLIEGLKAATG